MNMSNNMKKNFHHQELNMVYSIKCRHIYRYAKWSYGEAIYLNLCYFNQCHKTTTIFVVSKTMEISFLD